MSDTFSLLIEAQRAESLESLNMDDILAALQRKDPFDVSSRLWERLAFLVYQDSNFGLLSPTPAAQNVLSIINRLCKSTISRGFPVDGETFVGSSDSPDCPSYARERILYATLASCSREKIPSTLTTFSTYYQSAECFAQKLLNNDERFLTTMLILLPLEEILPTDSVFHPVAVFLEAMHLISYDCGVIIDWLNSELAASSLILRVLKSCCNPKTASLWKSYTNKTVSDVVSARKRQEGQVPHGNHLVSLTLVEIIGNQDTVKTLSFCETSSKTMERLDLKVTDKSRSFLRWIRAVEELRIRLKRLHKAKLVADKTLLLLKWSDTFCACHK